MAYRTRRSRDRPARARGSASWDGEADRMVSLVAVPDAVYAAAPVRRVFAGQASQVRQARRFVAAALDSCPVADIVVLLADELITNALVHTRSGRGGLFEVIVWTGPTSACVAVVDGGSEDAPSPARRDEISESGRGLVLVDALAACWGHAGDRDGRVTWFLVRWL
jgi:anti-sigma regulatory factor (Ser/Thr protein kinase)